MENITLLSREWNEVTGGYHKDWLADEESAVSADFDKDSNPGSTIYCIDTQTVFIKNSKGQWQRAGSTEVLE